MLDGVWVVIVVTPAEEDKSCVTHRLNKRRVSQQILSVGIDSLKK